MSKSSKSGDFEVKRDGYYFIYMEGDSKMEIDCKALVFGNFEGEEYADYGVIGLKKGFHKITGVEVKKLKWSGPDLNKSPFVD